MTPGVLYVAVALNVYTVDAVSPEYVILVPVTVSVFVDAPPVNVVVIDVAFVGSHVTLNPV
jgi:hypothetical protein